ncbi:MAG: hypothetical protein E6H95_11270, partial [Chloroflexi bacterium]
VPIELEDARVVDRKRRRRKHNYQQRRGKDHSEPGNRLPLAACSHLAQFPSLQ